MFKAQKLPEITSVKFSDYFAVLLFLFNFSFNAIGLEKIGKKTRGEI